MIQEFTLLVPVNNIKLPYSEYKQCPDINLGHIDFGDITILIKIIHTRVTKLIRLGFVLDYPLHILIDKFCIPEFILQVTDIPKSEITTLYPNERLPSNDDRILFCCTENEIRDNKSLIIKNMDLYCNINRHLSKFTTNIINTKIIKDILMSLVAKLSIA